MQYKDLLPSCFIQLNLQIGKNIGTATKASLCGSFFNVREKLVKKHVYISVKHLYVMSFIYWEPFSYKLGFLKL